MSTRTVSETLKTPARTEQQDKEKLTHSDSKTSSVAKRGLARSVPRISSTKLPIAKPLTPKGTGTEEPHPYSHKKQDTKGKERLSRTSTTPLSAARHPAPPSDETPHKTPTAASPTSKSVGTGESHLLSHKKQGEKKQTPRPPATPPPAARRPPSPKSVETHPKAPPGVPPDPALAATGTPRQPTTPVSSTSPASPSATAYQPPPQSDETPHKTPTVVPEPAPAAVADVPRQPTTPISPAPPSAAAPPQLERLSIPTAPLSSKSPEIAKTSHIARNCFIALAAILGSLIALGGVSLLYFPSIVSTIVAGIPALQAVGATKIVTLAKMLSI